MMSKNKSPLALTKVRLWYNSHINPSLCGILVTNRQTNNDQKKNTLKNTFKVYCLTVNKKYF